MAKKSANFDFLKKLAKKLGATSAEIIPTKNIVIEDRVVLKCKLGCEKYGKTLACPPHAPTPDQFRKIANEYKYAMFMKFKTTAQANSKLIPYLTRTNDPTLPQNIITKVENFWSVWKVNTKKLLETVLTLEKAAAKEGYLLAIGFVSGSCQLCNECNIEKGICVHPEMKRYSEEGVGVNVKATAEKAGVKFTLPFEKKPETFALLLID
jgi:predicted metal-binding protein